MPVSVRTRWAVGTAVGAAALVAIAVAVWPDATVAQDPDISVSRSGCGIGWTHPKPGPQTLQLRNTGSVTIGVDLIDPKTGTIYGEVEAVGSGTTRPLNVVLGNGDYAFRCLPEDTDALVGPAVKITGAVSPSGPGIAPVTSNDLIGPAKAYQNHVNAGLATLVNDTGALKAAVERGDRTASESAWLTAHLSYERLGAAYNAFGASDRALNGTTDGLPGGTADVHFTGFHRLEFGLWHGEDMGSLAAVTDQLDQDARGLQRSFPDSQVDQNDLAKRAHEIMENTLQFELTGRTDYGSGTNLATAVANIDGTRAVLAILRPLLTSRYPGLSAVDSQLDRTQSALETAHRPDGTWSPVTQLDQPQRQKIDGAVAELTELLAPIAEIAQPRRVS